jgi:hypothetical protein
VGGLVAAVAVAVDVNATKIECERMQVMRSAASLTVLVPPAHSVFLFSTAARIAWIDLRH